MPEFLRGVKGAEKGDDMLSYERMIMRLVFTELIGGCLALPMWWYGRGLGIVSGWVRSTVRGASETFALGVWVRNLFVPMYGETEWSGRLISFFVRLAMIFGRGTAVALWTALAFVAFGLYIVILPVAILGVLYHGSGVIFF